MTRTPPDSEMDNVSYPSLYRSADAASIKAQRTYLLLHKAYLGSLVVGSVTSALVTFGSEAVARYLYTGLAVLLVLGLLVLWAMRARQDEKTWFDGRAVAESVKTAAWKFMMRAPPFDDDSNAESHFLANLKEMREARPHLAKHLAAAVYADGSPVTPFMKEKRLTSLDDRRTFYAGSRIREQKAWYTRKAQDNIHNGARWFWAIAVLQSLIATGAIAQAAAGVSITIIPLLMTCVAAMAAWSQMKRYDELAQSYALAAQELEEIEAVAGTQASEDTFSQLVEQAEESISREHTMWCARRDVRLYRAASSSPRKGVQASE